MPLKVKSLHPTILERARGLHFRQSFIKDYLTCPKMSLYRWLLQLEEEQPFMAGYFGTAGHKVIEEMHVQRNFDMQYLEMMEIFEREFFKQIDEARTLPKLGSAYDSIHDQFDAMAPEYIELIQGYQAKEENAEFMSTIHEQLFTLEFTVEINGKEEVFFFTGQIDQGGFYLAGRFA